MSSFSSSSKAKLATCHSDLQILFNEVIKHYDCTIVFGFRNEADQNKAFKENKSDKKWPDSKHNTQPSLAVDAVSYEMGRLDWSKTQSAYFAGIVMGIAKELFKLGTMKHQIRCGIDWDFDNDVDDNRLFDAGHFEIIPN